MKTIITYVFVLLSTSMVLAAPKTAEEKINNIIRDYSLNAALHLDSSDYLARREKFEDQQIEKLKLVLNEANDSTIVSRNSWNFGVRMALSVQQHPKLLQFLIDQGLDVNAKDPRNQNSLLLRYSLDGKTDLARVLVNDPRTDVNAYVCFKSKLYTVLDSAQNIDDFRRIDGLPRTDLPQLLLERGAKKGSEFASGTCN